MVKAGKHFLGIWLCVHTCSSERSLSCNLLEIQISIFWAQLCHALYLCSITTVWSLKQLQLTELPTHTSYLISVNVINHMVHQHLHICPDAQFILNVFGFMCSVVELKLLHIKLKCSFIYTLGSFILIEASSL